MQHGPGRVDLQAGPVGAAPTVTMMNRTSPNLPPGSLCIAATSPVIPTSGERDAARRPWAEVGAPVPPCARLMLTTPISFRFVHGPSRI